MVEAVHVRRVEGAVRQNGVPPLPDCGRSHLHLIEPARVFLLQQEFAGKVVLSVVTEGKAEIWRADKAGGEMGFVGGNVLF